MDNEGSITPAIGNNNLPHEMTTQEFQKMLNFWFDEKGLVANLRSYLRLQMIDVLRSTAIGKNTVEYNQTATFVQQAVNLIVAEHLIQNRCHFTLSIFSTEASLSNVLPEFCTVFGPSKINSKTNWKFSEDILMNILELIGLASDTEKYNELTSLYYENNEHSSILNCLIHLLCKVTNVRQGSSSKSVRKVETYLAVKSEDRFIAFVAEILNTSFDIEEMFFKINNAYLQEKNSITEEYQLALKELRNKITTQEREVEDTQKYKIILEEKTKKIILENLKLKSENKRLFSKVKLLKSENAKKMLINDLQKPQSKITLANLDNKDNPEEITAKSNTQCLIPHCNDSCQKNAYLVNYLEKENLRFQELHNEQENRFAMLTQKYKEVLSDYESCQSKVNLLSRRLKDLSSTQLSEAQPRYLPTTTPEDVQITSCSSVDGLTDEIVYQARQKLQLLERESDEIDNKFKNFYISTI